MSRFCLTPIQSTVGALDRSKMFPQKVQSEDINRFRSEKNPIIRNKSRSMNVQLEASGISAAVKIRLARSSSIKKGANHYSTWFTILTFGRTEPKKKKTKMRKKKLNRKRENQSTSGTDPIYCCRTIVTTIILFVSM